MSRYEENIKHQLNYLLESDKQVFEFVKELSKIGDLLFFGGSIRDICLSPQNPPYPRDFDIAINFKEKNEFEEILLKYENKKNRFGGYKVRVANVEFDIWDLKNTWAFNNTDLKASEENLAKSVFLNIDGIVYNYNNFKIYDELFRSSIKNRKLDVNLEKNPQVELNLLRALIFKQKYEKSFQLGFSDKLKKVFKEHFNNKFVDDLYDLQNAHYKKVHLSKEKIKHELQLI